MAVGNRDGLVEHDLHERLWMQAVVQVGQRFEISATCQSRVFWVLTRNYLVYRGAMIMKPNHEPGCAGLQRPSPLARPRDNGL